MPTQATWPSCHGECLSSPSPDPLPLTCGPSETDEFLLLSDQRLPRLSVLRSWRGSHGRGRTGDRTSRLLILHSKAGSALTDRSRLLPVAGRPRASR